MSSKTAQRFLEYMSISYQTLVLQPWSRNPNKRLVKSPKVHYLDVGIMRAVLQKNNELNGHEFESAIISERTRAGMSAARQRGKHLGRPGKLTVEHVKQAQKWIEEGKSRRSIARLLKVSPATLYRHLNA